MDLLLIITALVVGLILLVAEVYLFPGISIAGIGATICLIFANVYAYVHLGTQACVVTFLVTLVAGGGILLWVFRSHAIERRALTEDIASTVADDRAYQPRPGDRGTALTRLALIGNAEIEGHVVEVKSADGFIDERTPIVVSRVDDGIILVVPFVEAQAEHSSIINP